MTTRDFYDHYHLQNDRFAKVISPNNFTYFYTLPILHEACVSARKTSAKSTQTLNQTQQPFTGLRVLDVGCGVATLTLYLASLGAQVTGVDISQRAITLAKAAQQAINHPGIKSIKFQVGEIGTGRQQFDLIICSEIIEHVPDQQQFLQKINANLRPGGILLLTTPSSQNLLYRWGFYQDFDRRVGHLRRYTPTSITKLLRAHHFQVKKLNLVEGPLRNILFTTPWGILIKIIRGPLVPLFHVLDRWSARQWGAADIQIIAQKI